MISSSPEAKLLARTPGLVQLMAFYRNAKLGASLGARLGIFRGRNLVA
jgi:hypothetical protein